MRTKNQIHCLSGHTNTVASVNSQGTDPQVISGSHDHTIKLWDLAAGKCLSTLTNHKKSIRALALHPTEYVPDAKRAGVLSTPLTQTHNPVCAKVHVRLGAPDNIKQWYLPDGKFIQVSRVLPTFPPAHGATQSVALSPTTTA